LLKSILSADENLYSTRADRRGLAVKEDEKRKRRKKERVAIIASIHLPK